MKLSYPPSGPVKTSTGYAVAVVPNIKNYHLMEVREQKKGVLVDLLSLSPTHIKLKSLAFIAKHE